MKREICMAGFLSHIATVCAMVLVGVAHAAGPWYVDVNHPNADDTNIEGRGTEALPFKTIQAALDNSSFTVSM